MMGSLLTPQGPVSKVIYFDRFRERTSASAPFTPSAIPLTERRSSAPQTERGPAWLKIPYRTVYSADTP